LSLQTTAAATRAHGRQKAKKVVVESRFISVSAIATLFVKTGNGCEGGKSHHYRSRSLPQDELTTGVKHQRQRLTSI
jgi:hypothetical protein